MTRPSTYNKPNRTTHICPVCERRMKGPVPALFTLRNAAKKTGLSINTMQHMIDRMDLDVVSIDSRLFIRGDEVERVSTMMGQGRGGE